ncbi:MAG: phosphatase PAP2 family protein [Prevotellaceae bacterium]|nr:phosphatase PAP2 family protein [Prevotellaceae bacterium]
MNTIIYWDTQLFLAINRIHTPFMDHFMDLYSAKWVWVPFYVALFFVICVRIKDWKRILWTAIAITILITLTDQTCAHLIRPFVERLRPANLENPIHNMVHIVNDNRGGRFGFPSCHSANSWGLTFLLIFLFRDRWLNILMITWDIIICYSRIYLGVHYPGDVLAATLVGLFWSYLTYRILRLHVRPVAPPDRWTVVPWVTFFITVIVFAL